MYEGKKKEENKRWKRMAKEARRESDVWVIVNKEREKKRWVNKGIGMEEWKEHFTKLGGIEDKVVREREKNDSRKVGKGDKEVGISKMEITKAIDRLKEGKAAGIDDIPSEVWKFGGKGMRNWVWEFCNRVWREEK